MNTLSESKLEEIIKLKTKPLLKFASNFCKNESIAEDSVQETFFKLSMQDSSRFKSDDNIYAWLFFVCKNFIIKKSRHVKKFCPLIDEYDAVDENGSAFDILEEKEVQQENARELKKLIAKLPIRYQQAIKLKFYENLPVEEIMKKINAPSANSLFVVVNNAKKKLKKMILESKKCLTYH